MKCKYFKLHELVSKQAYDRLGETGWRMIPDLVIQGLDNLRETFGKPILINNWKTGGNLSQRGYRDNICQIVKDKTAKGMVYLSAHCRATGYDINVSGMTSDEVYDYILANQKLFPYITRIENKINTKTWTHIEFGNRKENESIEVF